MVAASGGIALGRRQLYMLPTGAGLWFALVLFAMLLAAVNYNNGLAYLFTFLLTGIVMISMLVTHRNLSGLNVALASAEPVFAGHTARFHVVLKNRSGRPRPGVWVLADRQSQRVDLAPHTSGTAAVTAPTPIRGYVTCPQLTLSTAYPLGLLFSWSQKLNLPGRCLVYPRPGLATPLPVRPLRHRFQEPGDRLDGDDFVGLREYRAGDPPRHIHWKSAARGQKPHVKQFSGAGGGTIWLDWDRVPAADPEARLSQLCRWVLDAETDGAEYGLRIPGCEVSPNHGPTHQRMCLTALALWDQTSV